MIAIRPLALLLAGAVSSAGPLAARAAAAARDYRPVSCDARKPYAGAALHAVVPIPSLSPGQKPGFAAPVVTALNDALKNARTGAGAAAITAAVIMPGRGDWAGTIGDGDTSLFYWASAGKTMIAVVILQLVEEGRISLDDRASIWVKGLPNGDVITIGDLLAHTSGLFSANEDLKAHAERRAHSLAEDIRIVTRHGAMFCPGERWRYSNTGYAVLGAIIERVEGRSYAEAIGARIIAPLGLKAMRIVRPGDPNADVARLVSNREPPIELSWPGAAGPVVASAPDMIRFWAALLGGKIVRPETVASMFATLYPMFDAGTFYGLGVMAFDVPERDGGRTTWLGHAGGTPGANAVVAYSIARRAFVAVALTGDGSAPAAAHLLLRQLDDR